MMEINDVGICRLCATLRLKDFLTLISSDEDNICVESRKCLNLSIKMDDELPKCVCSECVVNLHELYAFYNKVHESQSTLLALTGGCYDDDNHNKNHVRSVMVDIESYPQENPFKVLVNETSQKPQRRLSSRLLEKNSVRKTGLPFELVRLNTSQKAKEADSSHVFALTNINIRNHLMITNINASEDAIPDTELSNDELANDNVSSDNYELQKQLSEIISSVQAKDEVELSSEVLEDEDIVENIICTEFEDSMAEEHLEDCFKELPTELDVTSWEEYSWNCYLCGFVCKTVCLLGNHFKHMHNKENYNEMQFECKDCRKVCHRYHNIVNHIRLRHHSTLKLRCDVCDHQSDNCNSLMEHRSSKCSALDYPALFQCEECGKSFGNVPAVRNHIRQQHLNQLPKMFECNECSKKFRKKSALRAHKTVHSDRKNFTCEICGKEFRFKINLEVHLNSHVTEKLFQCSVCSKSFKTSFTLEKHGLVHTDYRPFKCDYCNKPFRTKDSKVTHERTHTGDKPFQCSYCNRFFRFRSSFINHTNIHTGNRPYHCELCEQDFTNWSNYNKHKKRHHIISQYSECLESNDTIIVKTEKSLELASP